MKLEEAMTNAIKSIEETIKAGEDAINSKKGEADKEAEELLRGLHMWVDIAKAIRKYGKVGDRGLIMALLPVTLFACADLDGLNRLEALVNNLTLSMSKEKMKNIMAEKMNSSTH